jgi:Flp pilus assembly pilin Flp
MIRRWFKRLITAEIGGGTAIEYGFLVALIAIAMIVSLNAVGNALINSMNTPSNSMINVNP